MTDISDVTNRRSYPPPIEAERWTREAVIDVRRWKARLVSFRIPRPESYRFLPGQYARIGLGDVGGTTVWRPLSMVSGPHQPFLEFIVALVPVGLFSGLLEPLKTGDCVYLDRTCFGFLTLDQLAQGQDLWLLASGTGIGPFVSMLRDADTWRTFRNLVVVHSVREARELVYREELDAYSGAVGGRHGARCQYWPVVTREPYSGAFSSRIPTLLAEGILPTATGLPLDPGLARVMVCGNPEMVRELRVWFTDKGFQTHRRNAPGTIAFEKYW